jgi:hypothetical protein
MFYHVITVVNEGNTDETILTNPGLSSGSCTEGTVSDPFELTYGRDVERQIDKNGNKQTCSPYAFDPLRLRPGEYAQISTGEKDMVEWINARTGTVYFVFHYEVTQDWGKRLNVWHGKISSPVLKVDFGPTTNRVSNKQAHPSSQGSQGGR